MRTVAVLCLFLALFASPLLGQTPSAGSIDVIDQKGSLWADHGPLVPVGYAPAKLEAGAIADGVAVISLTQGKTLVSEATVAASAPLMNGRVFVDVDGPVNTGLAIANDQNGPAQISFYFTDETGFDFGFGTFTLEAKHNIAAFANQSPFNLSMPLQGSLTFSSSAPVAVTALRGVTNERGEFLMTSLPVVALGSPFRGSSIVLPQFAVGHGWSTQIILTNPTDLRLTGAIQFYDAASAGVVSLTLNGVTDSTFEYVIAPRSSVRLVTRDTGSTVHGGFVVVTAGYRNPLPHGLSLFSLSKEGITVTQSGVPASVPGTDFRTYVGLQRGVHSAITMANPSDVPAHAALSIAGSTSSVEIPAHGHVSRYVDELFPKLDERFQGTLSISSTAPIAATGLRLRSNDRGDALITSIPVVNGGLPSEDSDFVFPLIVRGGGYSTEFVGAIR